MSLELLKNYIKKGTLPQVYLFFGVEVYLINYYLKKLESVLIDPNFKAFNYVILEGKDCLQQIIRSCETVPIMGSNKLIVVKESKIFANQESNKDSIDIIKYLKNIPQGIYVVFVETEVNKKNEMYNMINKCGLCVEFDYQSSANLTKWVCKVFDSYKIIINQRTAEYLVNLCGPEMTNIFNEIKKLIDYVGEGNMVRIEDIDSICIKPLQNKVFEMVNSLAEKNLYKAYQILNEILILKEPLQKIMILVYKHFKNMFYVKKLKLSGHPYDEIAKALNLQPYIVNKYIKQSEKYSVEHLRKIIDDCLEIDSRVKTGRIDPRIGLETLMAKQIQKFK